MLWLCFLALSPPWHQKNCWKRHCMNLLSRTKSALQPLLSEVSTRTAELRDFESAINAKKQELERVSKKVEEVSNTLRCESLFFLWLIKLLFIFPPLHLYYQLLYFQRPGQQVNTYWWQLASSSRPACWSILIYLYRNDIVLCGIFCTLSQFSCRRKDCLSLPCPTFPMQAPSFLILPLGVNSQAASLQKRFKISASLCLSFVALSSYHTQLSSY